MSAHALPAPVGGRIWTPTFRLLAAIFGVGALLMVWRFAMGLGAATGLSDGYPWGIWIAFDVVVGTALGCGGYAMALLVYIFNRGQFHALVRPAILTSALGYTMASFAIHLDVGRPLYIYKIPVMPQWWNLNSVLLEVAVCVMTYVAVLWIELSPAFFERWMESSSTFLRRISRTFHPIVQKLMVPILAIGLLLPTMHQSSLGAVMLLAGQKLHGLWQTPLLPLLFLLSCVGMGYAIVAFESHLGAAAFGRGRDTAMLARLARVTGGVVAVYLAIRAVDIVARGRLGLAFHPSLVALCFWAEIVLFGYGAFLLLSQRRATVSGQLNAAILVVVGGSLYRLDTYLVAYNPGANWKYFPSFTEVFITIAIIALEIMAYVVIVKLFPIIGGLEPTRARS
ncbi:MAG TPA: Ni/Fe-hydrogenase cytochrome b subunit [Thermoanaerobaculaceae bacterium]|nr:Ni/Fe-hydrogenase cytochrome b subunit [Thermoanaerobaculaceae bacterium]HPS77503.1 Ni/Fe-hydrogenase cytochrome b subunit [Thermoanaerobaculaceae bacterium]